MDIIGYNEDHLRVINEWLKARGEAPVEASDLPKVGFVVPGIAAGFLRRCEGNYGFFDALVTNPKASPGDRDQAIDIIVQTIVNTANSLKMKAIMATTGDNHTLMRAKRFGFRAPTLTFITLNLEGNQ